MTRTRFAAALAAGAAVLVTFSIAQQQQEPRTSPLGYSDTPILPGQKWKVHDIDRPRPRTVKPGEHLGDAPSDAVVLFNGKDLSHWVQRGRRADRGKMAEPRWKVENGYVEIVGGTGDLISKEKFGDAQYHLEFSVPPGSRDSSQWKGNSGVLIMGRYEIQVLESFNNPTYADGQAAAIYGQWPPLVNASRPEGEWNVYDIAFEAPRFQGDKLVKPAYVTVFHNGVLVHHHQEIIGAMAHRVVGKYRPHSPEEPLMLQDHDVTVRYRNIWVRRITGYDQP
jgi:hypothetical protein